MANIIYDKSEDTKIRELARLREKALHDEASALKQAKDEGKSEGKSEGVAISDLICVSSADTNKQPYIRNPA